MLTHLDPASALAVAAAILVAGGLYYVLVSPKF